MKWTEAWPTEPGYYWLYGWTYHYRDRSAELYYVKVRRIANGFAYITDGHFLYMAEGAKGIWQPVVLPILPTDLPLSFFKVDTSTNRRSL